MAKKSSVKESTVPETTETTESTETTEEVEPFVSSAQTVGDEVAADLAGDTATEEPLSLDTITKKDIDNLSDDELLKLSDEIDSQDSTSELEEATEPETSAAEETTLSLEDDADGENEVSGRAQKRIDKLFAREKAAQEERDSAMERAIRAEERLKILEEQAAPPASKEITDTELKGVLDQCIQEGDSQGILDVLNYKNKKAKEELQSEYRKAEADKKALVKRDADQWNVVLSEFQPGAYSVDFLKDDTDFDIRNNEGKLFRLAKTLYDNPDKGYLSRNQGMVDAVRDAFMLLLRSKKTSVTSKKRVAVDETEGLKQRLAKERRKNSLSSGASNLEDDMTTSNQTTEEILDEVISERKALKRKHMGMGV